MALSNIGREPRREITESVIGGLAVVIYTLGDYFIVTRVFCLKGADAFFGGFIFGVFCLIAIPAAFIITHAVGEVVCEWLRVVGIDPRPRQRL